MKKIKKICAIFIPIIVLVIAVEIGIILVNKKNSVKYKNIIFNHIMLPYDGSKVLVNDYYNCQFFNTGVDLQITDFEIFNESKKINGDTIAKEGTTYTYKITFMSYQEDDLKKLVNKNTKITVKSA